MWDRVQEAFQESPRQKIITTHRPKSGVLAGILKCGGCMSAMTPTYTKKKNGNQYHYYAASNFKKGKCDDCPIKQVSSNEVERVVLSQLQRVFSAPETIIDTWHHASKNDENITEADVKNALQDITPIWDALFPAEQERLVHLMLEKAIIHPDHLDVCIRADGIDSLVKSLKKQSKEHDE